MSVRENDSGGMRDHLAGESMNGTEDETRTGIDGSCQFEDIVEQSNMEVRLPYPDMKSLEKSRQNRTREVMEVDILFNKLRIDLIRL